ncbi:helix-turn-helix domain-containing protein [Mariniflexile jejuense]|uniref:Helix-turn-helix domain-containing protein n=2 Tax=Mariniflexile jejuense TaxID=1173582 RepID=A0ABW3JKU8_9FLAO
MLLEMASGNFFYRLKRSAKNDNLEAISISLNMLAEEIQETLIHQGYVNSNQPIMEIILMSFVIDFEGYIEIANQQACNILTVLHTDIIGKPFDTFLDDHSKKAWKDTWRSLKQKAFQDTSLELKFISKEGFVVPKTCYITSFQGDNPNSMRTLVSVIHHATSQVFLEQNLKQQVIQFSNVKKHPSIDSQISTHKQKIRLTFDDIHKIREGRDIIINNLEMDFPSLKEFALQLGTNEFKLKYGFKELYGTTVHRFLMEERLRKSKMMIQFTQKSLKSIAQMTGFKSISHFSRTFKKRFDYSPSDLRKKSFDKDK